MGNPTRLVHNDMVIEVVPTAPASPVVGMPCRVGDLPGVPVEIPSSGGKIPLRVRGVFKLPVEATSGDAVQVGDNLYWGDTDDVLGKDSSGKIRFGIALEEVAESSQKRINVYMRDELSKTSGAPVGFQEYNTGNAYTTVELRWSPPTDTGGLSITSYTLQYREAGTTTWSELSVAAGATIIYRTVGSLSPGTSYEFRVQAVTSEGGGAWATITHATSAYTVPDAPPAPTLDSRAYTYITFSFVAPSNTGGTPITGYAMRYRETGTTGAWLVTSGIPSPGTEAIAGSAGTSYDIEVRATNSIGDSDWSDTLTASTLAYTVPGQPDRPTRTSRTTTSITWSWSAPSDDGGQPITAYIFEYREDGAGTWTNVISSNPTTRTYTATSLTPDTDYDARVTAVNSVGNSNPSDIFTTTTEDVTEPGAPTGFSSTSQTQTTITISWSAPSDLGGGTADEYQYRHRVDGTSTWGTPVSTGTSLSATVSGLTASTDYEFQVRVRNEWGYSAWTAEIDASTTA